MEQTATLVDSNLIARLSDDAELRPVSPADANELFAVVSRNIEHLHHWLPWATTNYSLADARRFVADSAADHTDRNSLTLTIRHKGAICGAIGLHRINRLHRSSSIGYWIDAAYEGKGIVTVACRAVIGAGFRDYGLHRIEIRCATWNHRSSSIPRRLGFLEEGILRDAEWLHDRFVDLRVFSMLAPDWTK